MRNKLLICLLVFGLLTAACGPGDPEVIKWGFIPADNADALQELSEPFVEFMSDYVGIPIEASLTQDYAGAITGLGSGQLDVAGLGPLGVCISTTTIP